MWMIERAAEFKAAAQARRNRGLPTGKRAKGWNVKRPGPAKGTWNFAVADAKARLCSIHSEAINAFADAVNPSMTDDDWAVLAGGL